MKKAIYKTGLSSKELLSLIDEEFFEIVPTKRKLMQFTRIFLDTFCEENDIIAPDLQTFSNVYGDPQATYSDEKYLMKINSAFTKSYSSAVESKNYYFLYEYFLAIFHELRHHCQNVDAKQVPKLISNISRIERRLKAKAILNNKSYSNSPRELDAKHEAFNMIKSIKMFQLYSKNNSFKTDNLYYLYTEPMQLVEFIKDKDLRKVKYITAPRKAVEALVSKIAIKNGLKFVIPRGKQEMEVDERNDTILNCKIAQSIAPEFYTQEFTLQTLSEEEEELLEKQEDEFMTNYDANLRKSKSKKPNYYETFAEK